MIDNISFKSRIRAVRNGEFARASSMVKDKHFVNYPWRAIDSVKADKAMTLGVLDCTVLGITDGFEVLLMHLCPTNPENYNFNKIKKYIKEHIEIENPDLQAVLFGSQDYSNRSQHLFYNLNKFIKSLNIPCSVFRNCDGEFNVGYSSTTDEWIVSGQQMDIAFNKQMTSEEALKTNFKEIQLSAFDEIA